MRNDAHAQLRSYAGRGALREVPAEVTLDEATDSQLEDECSHRGIGGFDGGWDCVSSFGTPGPAVDETALDEAAGYLGRGDLPEALVYLERALPHPQFAGLADRVARFYRSPT
jgi:hypothetical protein